MSGAFIHPEEFRGRRALVTGGSKGIGEAVVRRLMAGGATVATTARNALAADQRPDLFVRADVGTPEGAARVAEAVTRQWGSPDWVVHVVGGSSAPAGGYAARDDETWHRALASNLPAAVRLDRALLPAMVARGSGAVIHFSSIQRRLSCTSRRWPVPPPRRR